MPSSKSKIISNWKYKGLIYDDYNDLYEVYIKTMQCQHCNREFKNSKDRCMDHDHDTGLFRSIVCHKCNTRDSYINYPNGYDKQSYMKQYNLTHREQQYNWNNQKTTCICGSTFNNASKSRHLKSERHLKRMDIYMNNVD